MSPKEIKYDELCQLADEVFGYDHPCDIIDGKCAASRLGLIGEYGTCCRKCRHLGDHGCTEKILGCKLYFCGIAKSRIGYPQLRKIEKLESAAIEHGFHLIISAKQVF